MPLRVRLPFPSAPPPLPSEASVPLPTLQHLQTLLPDPLQALSGILRTRSYGEVTLWLKEARQQGETPHHHPLPPQSTSSAL